MTSEFILEMWRSLIALEGKISLSDMTINILMFKHNSAELLMSVKTLQTNLQKWKKAYLFVHHALAKENGKPPEQQEQKLVEGYEEKLEELIKEFEDLQVRRQATVDVVREYTSVINREAIKKDIKKRALEKPEFQKKILEYRKEKE